MMYLYNYMLRSFGREGRTGCVTFLLGREAGVPMDSVGLYNNTVCGEGSQHETDEKIAFAAFGDDEFSRADSLWGEAAGQRGRSHYRLPQ